jgi:flagellar protein FlgJ
MAFDRLWSIVSYMRNLLTHLALCVALPLSLDSAVSATTVQVSSPVPAPSPDFSIVEPEHARAYLTKIYPYAVQIHHQQGVPIPITLGIACLESGYGRSHYAQTRHNHFGIRSYQGGKAGYRHFSSIEDCFKTFAQLFELERYAPLRSVAPDDLPAFAQGLQQCGFNHRDKYRKKLLHLIAFLELEALTASAIA